MSVRCWNCGSPRYTETAAVESCPACGIRCNYHGDGPNVAYRSAMAGKHAAEAARDERERAERERLEDSLWPFDYEFPED